MHQIFLACGHTHDAPLPELVDEIRALEQVLAPLHEREILELIRNRAANVNDIFQTFNRNDNIQIFHYAGHADDQTLYLEEAGNITGIAELLGLTRKQGSGNTLQLVFLNGCSSKGQVQNLHRAGIAAVIATSRPVGDSVARVFATQFYQTWSMEGKSLQEAFEVAQARVHSLKDAAHRDFVMQGGWGDDQDFTEVIPWGLYFHPNLEIEQQVKDWILVKPVELPPMLLSTVKPHATQSLRALVHHFRKTDPEAQQVIQTERKDPLMVLIERLPWIIGTHLRRLFAVEADRTMTKPGLERLKELIAAYTDLTRFISLLSLSLLWDAIENGGQIQALPFSIIPTESDSGTVDFMYHTRTYIQRLSKLEPDDASGLESHILTFLHQVEDEQALRPGYLRMEAFKQAIDGGNEQFDELIRSRSQEQKGGYKGLVLEAEAIYAGFLKASLFLTEYKLHTVRSIVVDKIRNLKVDRPYSHYTISLHAAFSQVQSSLTERETASDNYCLLLTNRQEQGDVLANAVNLSPFYLDRSSFLEHNVNHYPAVFVLSHYLEKEGEKEYVFHYIDTDVNHEYAFAKDNQMVIDSYGAVLPDHLEVDNNTMERFEKIYEQVEQLNRDIPQGF